MLRDIGYFIALVLGLFILFTVGLVFGIFEFLFFLWEKIKKIFQKNPQKL